ELYQSMEAVGWMDHPIFDAIEDEHGVVLVGHRRLKVATKLGIDPRQCGRAECESCKVRGGHVRTVRCGRGDEADQKRVNLAVTSNIGHRDLSKGDRLAIVKVLAGPDHDWTQMSIAEALGVSRVTITNDIAALKKSGSLSTPDKPNRPKGGRPP